MRAAFIQWLSKVVCLNSAAATERAMATQEAAWREWKRKATEP